MGVCLVPDLAHDLYWTGRSLKKECCIHALSSCFCSKHHTRVAPTLGRNAFSLWLFLVLGQYLSDDEEDAFENADGGMFLGGGMDGSL